MTQYVNVKPMIYASLFAALAAVGAFIKIPIPISPVPITLQVFFVLLAGLVLGSRWGGTSMLVYVLLGIIGIPVFSGGSAGIGVLMGPTGGYIIGFIAGAFIVGLIHERSNKGIPAAIAAMIAGLTVIYLSGVVQLSIAADMPVQQAVVIGVLPFLVGDVIKMAAALIILEKVKPLIVLNDRT